jgi:hypothetical protein
MTRRGLEKRLQLLGIPRLRLRLRDRSQLGCMSHQSNVPTDEAASHRLVEGPSDDEMHLENGLWCQRLHRNPVRPKGSKNLSSALTRA